MKNPFKPVCLPCLIGALAVLALAAFGVKEMVNPRSAAVPVSLPESDRAAMVHYGQERLTERLEAGENLSAGPCLDNGERFLGWVIDIAHDPREAIDDLPENQCSAYRNGRTTNFIELDPTGNLIRIQP